MVELSNPGGPSRHLPGNDRPRPGLPRCPSRHPTEGAIADVVTAFRQRLENMPHRIAPEIVGKDLDAIRATLKQEVFGALAEMEREFSKHIEQMGSEE